MCTTGSGWTQSSEVGDQDDNGHNDSNSNEIPDNHRDDILGVSPQEGIKVGTMKSCTARLLLD